MPRKGMTLREQELAEELRSRYGGCMTRRQIIEETSSSYATVAKLMGDTQTLFSKYRVSDVARRMLEAMDNG